MRIFHEHPDNSTFTFISRFLHSYTYTQGTLKCQTETKNQADALTFHHLDILVTHYLY